MYIGLRDLDPGEREIIRRLKLKAFSMQVCIPDVSLGQGLACLSVAVVVAAAFVVVASAVHVTVAIAVCCGLPALLLM